MSYIFDKTLALSTICDKCNSNEEEILKKEEPIEIIKIIGLINKMNIWLLLKRWMMT